uniref:Uncharacterized protein n=1 Tax=Marmota marmota marmota TaxID=9994 RepID=A0A8C6EZS2_MARMA
MILFLEYKNLPVSSIFSTLCLSTENFQNSSLHGTADSLQLSLPVVTNAASGTGSVCNFSRASAPAATSAWLLPSTCGTSFQPLMGSSYLYQHASTAMVPQMSYHQSLHLVLLGSGSILLTIVLDSFAGMETSLGMEASLGLQPPSQTFCLPQPPEFPNSCSSRNIQILERNPPTALGDISTITPVQSSTDFLALPPNQSQEQTEIKNLCEIKTMLSEPLDAYQIAMENQDPPLLPLDIPEIHQLLASIGPLDQEEKPHSENIHLERKSLSLEDQGTLENGIEFSSGFADLTALVGDFHLPELFIFYTYIDTNFYKYVDM